MKLRAVRAVAGVLATLGLVSCGADTPEADPQPGTTPSTSDTASPTSDNPLLSPTIDGRFAVGTDQHELALTCWGEGSPAVLFDAGTGDAGIERWKRSSITRRLAAGTMTCAYDRLGLGDSDPAPDRPRTLDDVVEDLHLLLGAAGITVPLVLVGASGGGFDIYHHAGRYPDDVAGLVLLDVPAGQAAITPSDVPAWDSSDNPEHMDYVAVEHLMAVDRLPIPAIPVTVVTANFGQSDDPAEQRVWLEGSSRPVQVILDGGHNIYEDDPDGVLAEILAVLDAASG